MTPERELLREARDELRWCSGSPDFNEGGQARKGWITGPQAVLNKIDAFFAQPENSQQVGIVQVLPLPPQPKTVTTTTHPAPQVALTGNRNATDLSAPASAGPTWKQNLARIGEELGEGWQDLLDVAVVKIERELANREHRISALESMNSNMADTNIALAEQLAAVAKELGLPQEALSIAGCDVLAHYVRDLRINYEREHGKLVDLFALCKMKGMEITMFECAPSPELKP